MKCVAIDDEAMALTIMENYISKVPFLEYVGSFTNALQAVDFLNKAKVDLLFLDINMPDITGVQLLRTLKTIPFIIFTTAYSSYAVESYEYEAVDYLLKPIEFDRFLKAVNKAQAKFLTQPNIVESRPTDTIMVKSGTSLVKIKISEILYIEGTGNYVTIVLAQEKIMSLITLGDILDLLPAPQFSRVHKSFIVSLDKVRSIDRSSVKVGNQEIPLSATYREDFLKKI